MRTPRPPVLLAERLRAFRYHPDEEVGGLTALPPPVEAPRTTPPEQQLREYLSFGLGEQTYAVPLSAVQEILRARRLVEIPRAKPPLLGVLDLRGTVTPVYDLALALELRESVRKVAGPAEECEPVPREARILVARTASGPAGLWVDRVRDVIRLASGSIEDCPAQGAVVGRASAGSQPLVLLDIERVLS
jgi:purine-binding chemotaxis protein CheW